MRAPGRLIVTAVTCGFIAGFIFTGLFTDTGLNYSPSLLSSSLLQNLRYGMNRRANITGPNVIGKNEGKKLCVLYVKLS